MGRGTASLPRAGHCHAHLHDARVVTFSADARSVQAVSQATLVIYPSLGYGSLSGGFVTCDFNPPPSALPGPSWVSLPSAQ